MFTPCCCCCCCACRLPTLYLSECVLIYLEPGEAQRLLEAAAARTAGAGGCAAVAIYEQTRPDDAFGATMIANLEVRR
jgi:O-methyltransferase involved in polyketide biosynthesis